MAGIDEAWDGPAGSGGRALTWRRLDRRLWVVHDGTVPVGTVEHGARFVYIDAEGVARYRARTLQEAQSAVTRAIELPVVAAPAGERRRRLAVLGRGGALIAAASALVASAWVVGCVLFAR